MSITPEFAAALAANPSLTRPPPPPEGVPLIQYARERSKVTVAAFCKHFGDCLPSADTYTVADKSVPVQGGEIAVRCVVPAGQASGTTYPVLVWYHGGGWSVGNLEFDDYYLRTICVELQLAIVNVEYRLAPEHPFPVPVEDCYAALKWVAQNAGTIDVAVSKGFLVGGDSAGANLAACVALMARDDPFFADRAITGQYLREPMVVHPLAWPEKYKISPSSLDLNKEAPLLNSASVFNSSNIYGAPPTDTRFSVLLAPSHASLPRAYIQVMSLDPLHDDGVAYERALREAGVATKLTRYEGVSHGTHYAFPILSTSIAVDRDAREGLKWLLGL